MQGTPTAIRHDIDGNMWVTTQEGKVYRDGSLFLDISNKIVRGGERGLLAIAPSPASSNRFYLMYTVAGNDELGIWWGSKAGDTKWDEKNYGTLLVLEEYEGQLPLRKLLEIKMVGTSHCGKDSLCFRPSDGKLTWALGDGGFDYDPFNLSQRDEFLAGKIIALDVSNPLLISLLPISRTTELLMGVTVDAKGLRNPESLQYIVDGEREIGFLTCPGQGHFEWAEAWSGTGQNFGWRTYEGAQKTRAPFGAPVRNDQPFPYHKPFLSYDKMSTITGGRMVGSDFYFIDHKNGMFKCKPNLASLQEPVTFLELEGVPKLDQYTVLGQKGNILLVGGVLNGRGRVLEVEAE